MEQARQTVLGNGREIMLFHYGSLQTNSNTYDGWDGTPIADVDALKKEIPLLFDLARLVRGKALKGIYLPKLPNSEPIKEPYIFSYLGMLGLPLIPGHELTSSDPSVIYTTHALKDPSFSSKLYSVLNSGKQVAVTEELANRLSDQTLLENKNLMVFKSGDDPKKFLKMTKEEIQPLRDRLLAPLGIKFNAPVKVSFYLLGDSHIVIENFNDEPVDATIELPKVTDARQALLIPSGGKAALSKNGNVVTLKGISPRTLVAFEYRQQ